MSIRRTRPARPRPYPYRWASDVLQGLLIACVVGWVLDLPRRLFGWAFYTEQLLAVCLGLGLALTFIGGQARTARRFDLSGAITALVIVLYVFWQYATPAAAPLVLYVCLALSLVWAAIGSRVWAMRWFDLVGAVASLVICGYIAYRYEALTYEIALLADRGHRRQRAAAAPGAGSDAPHLGRRAGRHHPGSGGLCLHRPATCRAISPPGRCRRPA